MFRFVHVSHDNETDRVVETVEMEINSSNQWTDVADFFLRFLQASDFGYLTRQHLSDHFNDYEEDEDFMLGDNACEGDPDIILPEDEDGVEVVVSHAEDSLRYALGAKRGEVDE